MNRIGIIQKIKTAVLIIGFLLPFFSLPAQEVIKENIRAKATATDEQTIKLRWAPTSPGAWLDGRKYGYILERHTLMIDSIYQDKPENSLSGIEVKAAPLAQWEKHALESDYAAVIAQAFYGDEFEVTSSSSSVGSIINQANELEQRFATSIFMAEYDYQAAELAGWAYTDNNTRKNEQYLYRIILNRPKKQAGDTIAVFVGFADRKELPSPLHPDAVWGDRAVMLSWNYELLSGTYHSYHVERKSSSENTFRRITNLPVTALGEKMQSIFYTDSLSGNNTQYSYRIQGITTFNETGPYSEEISGQGKKTVSCTPNIVSGHFVAPGKAHVAWIFECETIDQIDRFAIKRAPAPDGEYEIVEGNIPVSQKNTNLDLKENINYIKLYAITKDSLEIASYPFSLSQEDSIPPLTPKGLKVQIDSVGVAHLSWNANTEPDLLGYRILRSFNRNEEKSSILPDFVKDTIFTDTLSMTLSNEKVYYSISAADTHFNESEACTTVEALKPSLETPGLPTITHYKVSGEGKVSLSWNTSISRKDIKYTLNRTYNQENDSLIIVFETDSANINSYTDEVPRSGHYTYWVTAKDLRGKQSVSPQKLEVDVSVSKESKAVSNFNSYADRNNAYIELSWKKHPEAITYRLYKQEDNKPAFLWKEIDAAENRIVDEIVSPGVIYKYTIIYINNTGRMSPAKTIKVDY